MPATKPIPEKIKAVLRADPFMVHCCLCDSPEKPEWHHAFKYAGQRVNEIWCILPLCRECHKKADYTEIKEKTDWIMINRAGFQLEKYHRFDWENRIRYLKTKHFTLSFL